MATNYNHIAYSKSADGKEEFSMLYPKINLEQHTEMLVDDSDKLLYGGKGPATATMTHENISIPGLPTVKNAVHITQTTKGQSGWSSRKAHSFPVVAGEEYMFSAYVKNNRTDTLSIGIYCGATADFNGGNPKYFSTFQDVEPSNNFVLITQVISIPEGYNYAWSYIYTNSTTVNADYEFCGYKVEKGTMATPWMPHESEVTSQDYPTYIGTYTDENQNSSTDPADYTWEMMNYRIYLDGIAVAGSKLLSAKVEDLKPDTSYTIQVKQVSVEEESDFSDSVTFKTNVQK
ncbi:fibronectin type III domain-containing protein [Lactococcus petauri]|uniref:fibronectin type III domain-containing protein n=1 Tax=Lactococcus petauri TaxID=1940789 RepID=UPI00254E2FF3|nr:fibronectin type III domain-containing protein [Lactococcus petauri]